MTWRRFVAWLTDLARTPFMSRAMARRLRRHHQPHTRIDVRQLEPIASPTSLTALPGWADHEMLAPGWDNAQLGRLADIPLAGSTALTTDTDGNGPSGSWEMSLAAPPASAGAIDVAAGMSLEDSSRPAIDDNDFASLNLATSPGMPASGAEPELGAASGAPVGFAGSAAYGAGGAAFMGAVSSSTPIAALADSLGSHALIPAGSQATAGPNPSSLTVPGTTAATHTAHTMAAPNTAAQLNSGGATSAAAGGGSSTATGSPATSQPALGPGVPPPITGSSGASIMPVVYDSTASDPAQEVVQVNGQAQGQNPMTQGFSQGGVRYADGTVQLVQPDLSSSGFASA